MVADKKCGMPSAKCQDSETEVVSRSRMKLLSDAPAPDEPFSGILKTAPIDENVHVLRSYRVVNVGSCWPLSSSLTQWGPEKHGVPQAPLKSAKYYSVQLSRTRSHLDPFIGRAPNGQNGCFGHFTQPIRDHDSGSSNLIDRIGGWDERYIRRYLFKLHNFGLLSRECSVTAVSSPKWYKARSTEYSTTDLSISWMLGFGGVGSVPSPFSTCKFSNKSGMWRLEFISSRSSCTE
jgi:hypothetical protein